MLCNVVVCCGLVRCKVVSCGVVCHAVLPPVVVCDVLWCVVLCSGVVCWSHEVCCGVLRCHVVWSSVMCCGLMSCVVVCCAEGTVTIRQWLGCLPTGTGKREGCVCSAHAVRKCVVLGGKRGSRGNADVIPVARVVIPGAPAVFPLSPLAGAGVAPATPTPSCCPGPGGLSATCHAPWRGRTRL